MPNPASTIRVGAYRRPTNDLAARFRQATGLNLFHYWDIMFGFDVVKFDEAIGTPDDVSTADHLKAVKGDAAVAVVRELLSA